MKKLHTPFFYAALTALCVWCSLHLNSHVVAQEKSFIKSKLIKKPNVELLEKQAQEKKIFYEQQSETRKSFDTQQKEKLKELLTKHRAERAVFSKEKHSSDERKEFYMRQRNEMLELKKEQKSESIDFKKELKSKLNAFNSKQKEELKDTAQSK